jgi:hypothetical protein
MKLKAYAKLITALAREETGSRRVAVELGKKCWWYEAGGVQHGYSEGYFVPVNQDEIVDEAGRDWEQDLVDHADRRAFERLDVPAAGEFTADFYISAPNHYGEIELDSNVVVTFQDGRPVYAIGTSGTQWDIDPTALTFGRVRSVE